MSVTAVERSELVECGVLRRPPLTPGYPFVGILPKIRRNPLQFFVETACRLGDVVELDLGPHRALMLNHPTYLKHVLQDNHKNYKKSKFYGPLKPMLGNGIFMSEGDAWLNQRRSAANGFHGCQIQAMVRGMTEATADMITRWQDVERDGRAIDIVREMSRLALDIVVRCLFNVRLEGQYAIVFEALTTLLRDAERRVWSFASPPLCVPTPRNLECRAALKALDHFVYGIIADRRANLGKHDDLLEILVTSNPQRMREGMPETLLRDQVLSFVVAGHETTANAMAWIWYLLSKHVDVARRVRSEVEQVLEGHTPRFEDLGQLPYARMVFDETLRLYPPVWTMSRDAIDDDYVGDIRIPAGITVMLCPYVVHRRPEFWPNPEGFDPERFAASSHAEIQRYAYLPFGGGPRGCLGSRFATIESIVILTMVTQNYRLELVPGQTVEPEPMITLRPRDGFYMRLYRT